MGKIVGVRLRPYGRIYDFDCGHFVLSLSDAVIVKTDMGMSLGIISKSPRRVESEEELKSLKPIYRIATEEDLFQHRKNLELEKEAHAYCQDCIRSRKLDMHLVTVETLFDNSKMIFYFTSEGRVDFRELVKDLVQRFRTRIEMRQIGVRVQTKMVGGAGNCGRELCCTQFIEKFEPVSVKMAKEQQLSLNPTKISGLCGRLMCCLAFEFQQYLELKERLPKCGDTVSCCRFRGRVIRQNVLKSSVSVQTEEGTESEVTLDEITAVEKTETTAKNTKKK